MKKTSLTVTNQNSNQFNGDLLVYCAVEKENEMPECAAIINKIVKQAYDLDDFSGKTGEMLMLYPGQTDEALDLSAKRLLIIGVGKGGKEEEADVVRENLREAGGEISKTAAKVKAKDILVGLPDMEALPPAQISQCLSEGILLGDYRFTKYKDKKKKENQYEGLNSVDFFMDNPENNFMNDVGNGARLGGNSARAGLEARDMANEPGNAWTPSDFAAFAEILAEKYSFNCTILEKKDMEKLGMGGLLAVNKGSVEPPKMAILEYWPEKSTGTILLVGKGITFDSGGISLKQAAGMEAMKYDMCGGAAVLAAMTAVGEEKPDVGVVAIVPSTDNMPGGNAIKPGDIIRHYNGVTAEIINTDAEGRLILADALAYGIEKYKPACVIDLATLTGAVIMGLGHHYSGLLSNNDALVKMLETAGEKTGEPLWRLPLGKPYKKQIESQVADIKNTGGKSAGTITAAAYLENFVEKTPWAHIDIAGTAWDFTEKSYIPKGPSGISVRTLIEFIRRWKTGML